MRKIVPVLVSLLLISGSAFAQSTKDNTTKDNKDKQSPKSGKIKSGTYFKVNIIHGDFDLYGFDYYFNDLELEVENHWVHRHAGLSGFSVGYRKEDFSSSGYGHFVNGQVFWKAEKRGFYFKPGIGVEWGKPSYRFEQTKFNYSGTELVSYERIYLERNAWMPVGVKNTGTLNPFFEFGVGQKMGPFIFEGGARVGYGKFVINTFQFQNGYLVSQNLNGEHKFAPTFYAGIGLKLF